MSTETAEDTNDFSYLWSNAKAIHTGVKRRLPASIVIRGYSESD
ncbi:MAG: hypothetical protein ACYDEX_13490 [Mobilitalea sp.]